MELRGARPEDHAAFVRLFEALQTGDAAGDLTVWSQELAPQSRVCVIDGAVVAYCYMQVLDGLGFVRHVAVDAEHRGRGIGRTLMNDAAATLRARGIEQWSLNVKPDNAPAIALYESLGMTLQHASVAMRMDWAIIDRLRATPADVEPLRAVDDPVAERTLGLVPGVLAKQREQVGSRMLLARRGEAIVGVAAFRPEFPGAYPFRALDSGVARALLVAMKPDADPSKTFMQLVFEDAAALADDFERAGARRHLEFVMLRGPVPVVQEGP